MFWIGPGNLTHTPTKDDPREVVRPGEKLPADLPAATVASLVKKGKAGKQVAAEPVAVPGNTERLQAALAQVAELEKAAADGQKTIDDLRARLDESEKDEQIEVLKADIAELTEQLAEAQDIAKTNESANAKACAMLEACRAELAAANQTIAELTEQLTAPAAAGPTAPAAGPRGGKK